MIDGWIIGGSSLEGPYPQQLARTFPSLQSKQGLNYLSWCNVSWDDFYTITGGAEIHKIYKICCHVTIDLKTSSHIFVTQFTLAYFEAQILTMYSI